MVIGMANGNKRFPQNSKISTQAQITRTCIIPSDPEDTRPAFTRYGIAAKFTSDFKLSL
ncbi:MAG: hypothetical protein K9M57_07215 [Phycisphaerae bacterium]|nr:hypothetical protein [Phycisphaerae bacterium]